MKKIITSMVLSAAIVLLQVSSAVGGDKIEKDYQKEIQKELCYLNKYENKNRYLSPSHPCYKRQLWFAPGSSDYKNDKFIKEWKYRKFFNQSSTPKQPQMP